MVLSVGLAPGLTNLLAAAVHQAAPGPGYRHRPRPWQASGGCGGGVVVRACWGAGSPIPPQARACATTRGRVSDLPGPGTRRLYRADFPDQHVSRATWAWPCALTSASTAGGDGHAGRPDLGPRRVVTSRRAALPGGDRWLALASSEDVHPLAARGRLQSHATAVLAVAAARRAVELPAGVHHLHRVMDIADVPAGAGIEVAGAQVG